MDFMILDERSQSQPASTWTEYLCLVSVGDDHFRLDVRTRPIICEYHEWLSEQQDEDAEEFNYDIELPDTINGKPVYGVEEEIILADELPEPINDDEMSKVFDLESMEKAQKALEQWKWDGISSEVLSSNIVEIQNS
ncbi:MAG: hypothetical protein P8O70_09350 [SAR324 cluster bacterium]|nr:hypothetical protein [SAR324 cluster bacterium]